MAPKKITRRRTIDKINDFPTTAAKPKWYLSPETPDKTPAFDNAYRGISTSPECNLNDKMRRKCKKGIREPPTHRESPPQTIKRGREAYRGIPRPPIHCYRKSVPEKRKWKAPTGETGREFLSRSIMQQRRRISHNLTDAYYNPNESRGEKAKLQIRDDPDPGKPLARTR